MRRLCFAAGAALIALSGGTASAQVVLLQGDYDTVSPDVSYGYTYAGSGAHSQTNGEVAGGGAGGTDGYQVNGNLTFAAGGFAGIGGGVIETASPPLQTPVNPADFTYTLALMANGLNSAGTTIRGEFQFRAPDDTLGPDGGTDTDVIARVDVLFPYNAAQGTYQTFTGNLSQGTFAAGTSLAQLQQHAGSVNSFQLNFNVDGALGDYGADANNILGFDSITVSQVPEPATLGLLGLAGLALTRVRRRPA